MAEKAETKAAQEKYTKRQLVKSGKWSVDVLNAILEDNKEYTTAEVDKAVNNFLKRSVN